MYFLSEASRGAKNQRPCKRKALRTHIPAQSFRRSSRELAHSARIVCLSARICRTDLAPKAETAETIEYFNIRRKEAESLLAKMSNTSYIRSNIREYEVVADLLYSRKILKIS